MADAEMGVEEARKVLGVLVTAAARDGQSTVLTVHGIPAARIVPLAGREKEEHDGTEGH